MVLRDAASSWRFVPTTIAKQHLEETASWIEAHISAAAATAAGADAPGAAGAGAWEGEAGSALVAVGGAAAEVWAAVAGALEEEAWRWLRTAADGAEGAA